MTLMLGTLDPVTPKQQLLIVAHGKPITQGSSKAFVVKTKAGKQRAVVTSDRPENKSWRSTVSDAAREAAAAAAWTRTDQPVALTARFYVDRPRSHFGTGRNATVLKPSAPRFPITTTSGDYDKLLRSVGDALTDAGVWLDDSQVVDGWGRKFYVGSGPDSLTAPGVVLEVVEV